MNNQIQQLRDRLRIYWKLIISNQQLKKLLQKFGPSYKISELSLKWLISPLKRGKKYINNLSEEEQDPYRIIDAYFDGENYIIGWIDVYNFYGLSTQVAEWYTIYNTKVSGKRIIWKNKFILKKQSSSFFYGQKKRIKANTQYIIMTPERAVIQMIKDQSIPEYIPKSVDKEKLLIMAKKYSNKRIQNKIIQLCT